MASGYHRNFRTKLALRKVHWSLSWCFLILIMPDFASALAERPFQIMLRQRANMHTTAKDLLRGGARHPATIAVSGGKILSRSILVVSDSTSFTAANALERILAHYEGQIKIVDGKSSDDLSSGAFAVQAPDHFSFDVKWPLMNSESDSTSSCESTMQENAEPQDSFYLDPILEAKQEHVPEVHVRSFTNCREAPHLDNICALAEQMKALVVFTLVDKTLHTFFRNLLHKTGVQYVDLLEPSISALSQFYGGVPPKR